jgi:hypothetical protein
LIDRRVNIDELPPEARARVMAQIGEDASKKRVRPEGICAGCGKKKSIYNHLDGDQSKPLCGACSMKLHRQSPGAVQTKVSKVGMQAIGSLDSLLGQPGVEQAQKNLIQQMQDGLKLMVRRWLGDTSVGEEAQADALASAQESTPEADQEAHAATATAQAADLSTGPRRDEFSDARKVAVGEESDKLFEVSNQPSTRKSRKARAVSKAEGRKTAKAKHDATEAMAEPNIQSEDTAYQEYLEAPLK